jgi:cell division protein YceG involved in septum cleavage
MRANVMNSFATGLLVATSVCAGVYFFGTSESSTSTEASEVNEVTETNETETQTAEVPSEKEMKDLLTTAGYIIHTEKEWEENLAKIEANQDKANASEDGKEKVVYKAVLNVSQGMTSIDVGKALVQANIIDNAMTFYNEVEDRGLANELRPGTFELDSEMSLDEAINTIFK